MKNRVATEQLRWYVSSYTGGKGNCVQVTDLPAGGRALRDSKHPAGAQLPLPPAAWTAFINAIRRESL
ncbi:DUF397 domain-containing protein [Nocardiopsis suaedae]|uniref:DUF397 domain-containing protein n=1 Tax=Nocardiopsis suaedae TaxID=3018444 RepID=A0ABT4TSL8_9ACTN|nr:DUF397 domain-containing protein [Nocardiopsis suaedae]MDA2807147.1 DUF397 domain-containing protein [Nocardiopsis suaedae]